MSFNYSPKITTDGLVFYTDPFNFKSRNRSVGLTGGTIIDLTSSSYGFEGTFTNEPEVSNDYKYITFDGSDDFILFPYSSAESIQEQMPFYRYKPKTFTMSAWVKSGTTGGGGVMFFGGGNDYFLKIPALTATTSYAQGVYTGVIGENWSGTTTGQTSLNLPSFEVTIDSGGTITKAVAETTLGFGEPPDNEEVIVKLSGDTIGGSTPADDAYLLWRSGTSSQMRWGFGIGGSYGMTISDSIDRGTFITDRVSNEPQEWNLITITDVGELVTNNLKCYVNGELVNQDTSTFLNGSQMNPGTINAGQINIGKGAASSFGTFLNGSLGPCMMYDRALSQNEILRNYEALKNRFEI